MADLTILGGGPAGLAVAFYAHKAGHRFRLYEKSAELGGMCRTFQWHGHSYDAGAHRFHDRDPDITRDIRALMGDELRAVDAPSKLWTGKKLIDFPPTPLNAAFSFGISGAARIAFEVLYARLRSPVCVNFGDFARAHFGETLARRLLIDYSEKLWGLPADQLSPDIATRRLQGMTLYSLLLELLFPNSKTAHIDGEFLYPRRGYGEIAARMAASLPQNSLATDREVVRLEAQAGLLTHIHFRDGRTEPVSDGVVSTLPLTLLVKLLGDQLPAAARDAAARLRFRQLRLIFLRLGTPRVSENASIYIPNPEFRVSRVYEPKIRSSLMAPANETSLVAEVACFPNDAISAIPDEELAARVVDEIVHVGLIKRQDVLAWRHHLLPSAYPVYSLGYKRQLETIAEGMASFHNLDTLGRAGSFYYSHLHDQLRLGKNYVESLDRSGAKCVAPVNDNDDKNEVNRKAVSR